MQTKIHSLCHRRRPRRQYLSSRFFVKLNYPSAIRPPHYPLLDHSRITFTVGGGEGTQKAIENTDRLRERDGEKGGGCPNIKNMFRCSI